MRRCVRKKRVRVRGQGMQLRCAKYSGAPSRSSRRRKKKSRPSGRCTSFKRVRTKAGGTVRRCKRFAGGRSGRSGGGFRRGHRPFNKGRKCSRWGVGRGGKRVCRSYLPRVQAANTWIRRATGSAGRILSKSRMLPSNAGPSVFSAPWLGR